MSRATLPGDLTSNRAGPLLRRGAPVVPAHLGAWVESGARGLRSAAHASALVESVCPRADESIVVLLSMGWGNTDAALTHLDLTDPAGMDLATRWLARHHGLTLGATAPDWARFQCGGMEDHYVYGPDGVCRAHVWSLMAADPDQRIDHADCGEEAWDRILIPGIGTITDPAEALMRACLAAGGR